MSTSVWVGSTEFTQRKVFNVRFKQKLNQVGTFSFTAIKDALTSAEKNKLVPGMIIRISVGGNIRFEGYITNVTKDKSRRLWEVEGESLAGSLPLRRANNRYYSVAVMMIVWGWEQSPHPRSCSRQCSGSAGSRLLVKRDGRYQHRIIRQAPQRGSTNTKRYPCSTIS